MKAIWYVAKKDLLHILRDRYSFIIMLLVPFILVTIIGLALPSLGLFGNSSQSISLQVAVSDQDHDAVGQAVVNALKIHNQQLTITLKQYATTDEVKKAVADSQGAVTGVVIPAGTTARLRAAAESGQPTRDLVQIYTIPTSNDPDSAIVENIVTGVVGQLSTAYFAGSAAMREVERVCQQPGNYCAPATINPATIASNVGAASVIESANAQVSLLHAGNVPPQINAFDIMLPGYALLFSLFGLQSVAGTILEEREEGTLRRLLITPVSRYALLGGKMLAQFLVTFAQLLILFIAGYLVFHLHIASWPLTLLFLLLISFAVTGLGMLLVSVVRTRRQLSPVVTVVTLISSGIGGAWWPLWLEPQWLQNVAKIGVVAWAMEGLNGIIVTGRSFGQLLPDLLALLIYGAVCFLIGVRLFRFRPKTAAA
jgi:ABC-2 type transport system permease protein